MNDTVTASENGALLHTQHKNHPTHFADTSYAQQLVDNLSRRNRNLAFSGLALLLISVGLAVATTLFYQQQEFTSQAWKSRGRINRLQQTTITELQHQLSLSRRTLKQQQNKSTSQINIARQMAQTINKNEQLKKINQLLSSKIEKLHTQNKSLQKSTSALAEQNKVLQNQITTTRKKLTQTVKSQKNHSDILSQLTQKLTLIKQTQVTLKNQNSALKQEVSNRKSAFDALAKRNQNYQNQIQTYEQETMVYKQKFQDVNSKYMSTKEQLNASNSELTSLRKDYKSLQRSLHQLVGGGQNNNPNATAPSVNNLQ